MISSGDRDLNKYCYMPLFQLAECIAQNGDRTALLELHDHRRGFSFHGRGTLSMADFISELRESKSAWRWCNGDSEILEEAYDLTVSKFSNLPALGKNGHDMKLEGPDCRYYFEAYVNYAAKRIDMESHNREAEKEIKAIELLQNLVVRHFRLSCLECCRKSRKLIRRYLWKINGYSMHILLPIDIPGNRCRKWLSDHISDVDPSRPGERNRVQAIVDNLTRKRKFISLEDIEKYANTENLPCFKPEIEQEITVKGLADTVADEKAENIEFQREVIQRLGKSKLRRLIRQIFDSLACGEYKIGKIAERFEINQSTFSRFAGSNWLTQSKKNQDHSIPDLWFNTSQTLAGHPVFVRVAEDTGILDRVEKILKSNNVRRGNGVYNE